MPKGSMGKDVCSCEACTGEQLAGNPVAEYSSDTGQALGILPGLSCFNKIANALRETAIGQMHDPHIKMDAWRGYMCSFLFVIL